MPLTARAADQPGLGAPPSRGHVAPIGGAVMLHMACLVALAAYAPSVPPPSVPTEEHRVEVMFSPRPASVISLPPMESVTDAPLPPTAGPPPPEPASTAEPTRADAVPAVSAAMPTEMEQPAVRPPPPASVRQPVRRNLPSPPPAHHLEEPVPPAAEPLRAAPPVAPDPETEARLAGRVREAVQAAVRYPPAARMMGLTGRARVLLDYRSGTVDDPTLAQSSGAPLLDTAALTAAREAHYPKPPPDLENKRFRFLVWVEFRTS